MAYTKTTWRTDDTITAEKLNNAEQGIAQNAAQIQENTDDIESLMSELNVFGPSVFYDTTIKRGINLFNKNDSRNKDGYYRNQNGALIQAAGTGLFLSHPIAVKAGVEYSAIRKNGSYGSNSKGFVVDASGDIVYGIFDCQTKTNASGVNFITFTPEKNCLVQLNLGKDSGTYAGYLKENCMVCKTSDMPSGEVYLSYEPYMTEALTNVDSNRKEPASNIEIVKAGNLFNKDDADIISNKYISFTLMDGDGYYVSHPILVKKGVKYAVTHGDALGNSRMLIYLDHDMNMLPNGSFCTQDSTYPDADVFTARMTGYVRVNLGKHPEKIVMCEADNYNGFYCDFGFTLPKLKYPQLYGKIVSFNGDSICAGQGYSGGYGKIIAERNGMIYENIGVNGGTITAETYHQNGNPRHWISRTIENMRADADYIILEGGVNDSVANIGTVPDVNDYTSTLDDTIYAQAFESMLKKAIDRFKGKKIGYIAIHKCTVTFTSNGNEERNRYTIAINACKKWGIPVCDLNINCPPLGYIDSLKADYTYQGDGWHPNEAGYKEYYVPKIEAWMASL